MNPSSFLLASNLSPSDARNQIEKYTGTDVRSIAVGKNNALIEVCQQLGIRSVCIVDDLKSDLAGIAYTLGCASKCDVHALYFAHADMENFPAGIMQRIQNTRAGLLLMDCELSDKYGTEIIRELQQADPPPISIGMSSISDNSKYFIDAGADGFVTKQSGVRLRRMASELAECLQGVLQKRQSQ